MLDVLCILTPPKPQTLELWSRIPGWPEYRVSDHGRFLFREFPSGLWKPLHLTRNPHGYLTLSLSHFGRNLQTAAHRAVAWAFLGPQLPGTCVNHKNGVKWDNRLSNLEYCTPSENIIHGRAMNRLLRLVPEAEAAMSAVGLRTVEQGLRRLLRIGPVDLHA